MRRPPNPSTPLPTCLLVCLSGTNAQPGASPAHLLNYLPAFLPVSNQPFSLSSLGALPVPQVYYPVAPEVYRDLLWEDVDVADPAEYTFCRYTPITTEVRGWWGA